jgi:hypothetical protein
MGLTKLEVVEDAIQESNPQGSRISFYYRLA